MKWQAAPLHLTFYVAVLSQEVSHGLGSCQGNTAAAVLGGLHYRGQCAAHVCAQISFLCGTASNVQRHKKYQVTL